MSTKAKVQSIFKDIDAALAEIAKKHDLKELKLGNCTFTTDGFSSKLEGVFSNGESKEMIKLRQKAHTFGLKEDVCNAKIKFSNSEYSLIGLRNTKMVLEANGRTYVADAGDVVRSIKFYNPEFCL